MRVRELLLVLAVAVPGALPAQAPPGRKATTVGDAVDLVALGPSTQPGSVFAALAPPITAVEQLEFHRNLDAAGNALPGQFHLTATVARSGTDQIMTGVLDTRTNPWTFTETTQSVLAGISTAGMFNGAMTADLLVLFVDSPASSAWSVRASRAVSFPPLQSFGGVAFADSRVFQRDGADWYAYKWSNVIGLSQIDRARYQRGQDPRLVATIQTLVPYPFHTIHSHAMLNDGRGEARAVVHSADMNGTGVKARPWFNAIVRVSAGNTEVSKQFHTGPADDSQFLHPGALAGSTIYASRSAGGAWGVPKLVRIVASSGDRVPPAGGVFRLSAWLPFFDRNQPPAQPWAVTVLLGVPANDLTVPGFRGKLALALAPSFVALPVKLWVADDTSADWVVPAPPLPAGTLLWTQTLVYDPAGMFDGDGDGNGDRFYLGNTGPLLWQ